MAKKKPDPAKGKVAVVKPFKAWLFAGDLHRASQSRRQWVGYIFKVVGPTKSLWDSVLIVPNDGSYTVTPAGGRGDKR